MPISTYFSNLKSKQIWQKNSRLEVRKLVGKNVFGNSIDRWNTSSVFGLPAGQGHRIEGGGGAESLSQDVSSCAQLVFLASELFPWDTVVSLLLKQSLWYPGLVLSEYALVLYKLRPWYTSYFLSTEAVSLVHKLCPWYTRWFFDAKLCPWYKFVSLVHKLYAWCPSYVLGTQIASLVHRLCH